MTLEELEMRRRIESLVESVGNDPRRSSQLFEYLWSVMCVRQGLMRVVADTQVDGTRQLVLEEVKTGRSRRVAAPPQLDSEIESLAVQALARLLLRARRAG